MSRREGRGTPTPIAVPCPDLPVFQGRGASAGHSGVNSASPQACQCHPSWCLASGSRHWLPRAYLEPLDWTRDHEGMVCLLIKRTGRPGSRSPWSPEAHSLPLRFGMSGGHCPFGLRLFQLRHRPRHSGLGHSLPDYLASRRPMPSAFLE